MEGTTRTLRYFFTKWYKIFNVKAAISYTNKYADPIIDIQQNISVKGLSQHFIKMVKCC